MDKEISFLHLSFNDLRYIIMPVTKYIKDYTCLKGETGANYSLCITVKVQRRQISSMAYIL